MNRLVESARESRLVGALVVASMLVATTTLPAGAEVASGTPTGLAGPDADPGTPSTEPVAASVNPPAREPELIENAGPYAEFRRLFDGGDYAAAVEAGLAVVALAERQPDDPSTLQIALMNLGHAQQRAGDYLGAEATYLRAIELIETAGRRSSPRLARAHAGLATAYYSARRYDLAAPALDRAIAINRRTEGLFNEDQLPLLAMLSDSLTQLGRAEEALQARRYALRLAERRYGAGSLRFAQELESLGRWFTSVGAFEPARTTLNKARDTVDALQGPDSIDLVAPLTAIADNARRWLADPEAIAQQSETERRSPSPFESPTTLTMPGLSRSTIATEGLRALERAATIASAAPDISPQLVAIVRTQFGDWHQARGEPDRAILQYRQAWLAASLAESAKPPLQEQIFATPSLLQYAMPEGWNRYAERPAEEVERRHIEVEFTVTAQGDVRDVKVLDDAGNPKFATRAERAIGEARYRPRFADGEPVDTHGVRFLQPVYTLRGDEEDAGTGVEGTAIAPEDAGGTGEAVPSDGADPAGTSGTADAEARVPAPRPAQDPG